MRNDQITILVTGANGQMGNELRVLAPYLAGYRFLFVSKEELNITDVSGLENYFSEHRIDFCINCAAYTAVDKAESEPENAFLINATAVAMLAAVCENNNAQLIHISTDYVFDGTASHPYKETDKTNPVSVYGKSKLQGEISAIQNCPSVIIIRTAWLYSSFNANFVKTMLRLMKEKESINVVSDQFGCPTYAADLAMAIMQIIMSNKCKENPGIYHYTNTGVTNWHEFAIAIKKLSGSNCSVNPIPTAQYPTAAKRPAWSVLDTTKIKAAFSLSISDWEDSLKKCLQLIP